LWSIVYIRWKINQPEQDEKHSGVKQIQAAKEGFPKIENCNGFKILTTSLANSYLPTNNQLTLIAGRLLLLIRQPTSIAKEIIMEQKNGPWTIQKTHQKYQNSFINVCEDQVVQPDGQPGMYATVKMKPGVAILPIDSDRNVYLIRQFRYALGKESIEVVCGAVEENEPWQEAAQREIEEEVGIKASELIDLGIVDLDTSIVRCPVQMFLAKQLALTETHQEGTETIKTLHIPLNTAVKMVMDNVITHAPSCVLILKAFNEYINSD
jgi:ADP-ribose pyrophosphatase YjhB (NUDIX family)